MHSGAVRTFVLVVLLVSAGCSGLQESEPDTPTVTAAPIPTGQTPEQVVSETTALPRTETRSPTVTTGTGTQRPPTTPVEPLDPRSAGDAAIAFERLTGLFDVHATAPTVETVSDPIDRGTPGIDVPDRFETVMGLGPAIAPRTSVGTVSPDGSHVRLVAGSRPRAILDHRLADLHAQSLQRQRNWSASLSSHWNGSIDQQVLAFAMCRGGAALAADAYARAFDLDTRAFASNWSRTPIADGWLAREAIRTGYERLNKRYSSPRFYHYGFQDPPNTTEQYLHNLSPATEPAVDLEVTTSLGDGWTVQSRDSLGELTLRAALATRLGRDAASEAVDDWGSDRLLTVSDGEGPDATGGVVLVTTWDRTGAAGEFFDALNFYVQATHATLATDFRVSRGDAETVVLVAGNDQFLEQTTISVEDGDILVSVGS